MLKLFSHLGVREWAYLAASLVFILAQVYFDLLLPDYMAQITRLVETQGSELAEILSVGGAMLGCAAGSLACAVAAGYFAARIAAGFAAALRSKMFDRTLEFSLVEFGRFSTASLITRCTNDLTQIQMFIAIGLQALVKAPILAVWAICKMVEKSWEWSLTAGVVIAALVTFVVVLMALVIPRFAKIQSLIDNVNLVAREGITGIRDVRAYNAESYQQDRFKKANDELTNVNLFANRVLAFQSPAMTFAMSGLTLAIYWVGIYLIDGAVVSARVGLFADMVAFSSYAMLVAQAFMLLTMMLVMMPRVLVSARRVSEVIFSDVAIMDGPIEEGLPNAQGSVRFDHVSFRYPGGSEYALRDCSFTAEPGQTIAIVGSTGSGKTTLLNLIVRLYEATEGNVLVDGEDVRMFAQESLREGIGYATQKPILFGGTVASNVAYGKGKSRHEEIRGSEKTLEAFPLAEPSDETRRSVKEAIEVAQASDFVNELPDGIMAEVSQGGTNFSGGQRQRLSIARTVCRQPSLYLFDDAFSALDYRTERDVRKALAKHAAGSTSIIVAQRIGTVMDADKIIVLDEGRIVGQGTHDELMRGCHVYQEIAASQLSEKEMRRAQ